MSAISSAHHSPNDMEKRYTARKAGISPSIGICARAITLEVAGPPMRLCRMTMKLDIAIGKTANTPDANAPIE